VERFGHLVADDDVAERLAGDGSEFGKNTPEQFGAF
jgi:hypothetical protein